MGLPNLLKYTARLKMNNRS